jgi:peptide chain release factor 1
MFFLTDNNNGVNFRVYDHERAKLASARQELRSASHGTGDRSDKIRTYNFPQDRVSDHRAGVTITGVHHVMNGELLGNIVTALIDMDELQRVNQFVEKITSVK